MTPIVSNRLFGNLSESFLARAVRHSLLFSPSTGGRYAGPSLSTLLVSVMTEILQTPISLNESIKKISKTIGSAVKITSLGPANATNSIKKSMQALGVVVEIEASDLVTDRSAALNADAIAIVGMAARLPGSETLEEFWQVLEEGRDLHEKIRPDRFDVGTHCDPSGKLKNSTLTPYGVFIDRPGYFDTRMFNMSPREASQTDPQQRLMLLTAYEALEMAGYAPNRTPSTNTRRIASFMGQTSDDYREVNASQDVDTYFITGGIRAFGPGRINYHFGWEGPSFSLDTACSSSAGSIQLACSALLARECDTALGGGANFLTASDLFAGLSRGSFLSKTGGCKTFDHDADGYVRADAVGVVVLKRLEDAIADRDNIQAVLRGAVTNHSAEAVSITHPHAATQERLFKAVLNTSGVAACDVDYAELHGTGTQAGDATESKSVTNVLCQGRGITHPLYIGTVKPNIGHGEAASGVTSLIKAIMMLRKNMIPPHIGIKGRINQKLPPLKELNTHISFGKTPFLPRPDGDGKRRILINNFDAAGGNTSMLLEDPPQLLVEGKDPRNFQIVTVSGKTSESLNDNCQRLLTYLKENTGARLEDVAYTTTARRMHHVLRSSYSVSSLADLTTKLDHDNAEHRVWKKPVTDPKIVFIFTGQGSQYTGMASQLFSTHHGFRQTIEDYDAICVAHGFPSFLPAITQKDFDATKASPVIIQLAIVSIELAIAALWKSFGIYPSAVVGHSLGEYAALSVAGVLSISTTLYLVGSRATLISAGCVPGSHAMLAIKQPVVEVQNTLKEIGSPCEIACINSPTSTVVSGAADDVQKLHQHLQKSPDVKSTLLNVQFAFHSSQLDPIIDEYARTVKNIEFSKPVIPIASTLLGTVVKSKEFFNAHYLVNQTRKPVQFVKALQALREELSVDDSTIWIETGPNPVCSGFVRPNLGASGKLLASLKASQDDWKTITTSLVDVYNAGVTINWSEYQRPHEASLRLLELPNYAFDLKNYWIQYEGDWSIRKGTQQSMSASVTQKPAHQFTPTTSLHRIVSQSSEAQKITVRFATDAWEPKLHHALRGHLVNGAGLCPSTVYADMAFTAASYLQQLLHPGSKLSMDVNTMSVHKPLLIQASTQQTIYVTVTRDPSIERSEIEVVFSSQDGDVFQDHAHCLVSFGDGEDWKTEWAKTGYLVRTRMNQLTDDSQGGSIHKILRPMVYKLFKALVDYDDKFQGMQEVYMDSQLLEATAKVQFRTVDADGDFMYSPYWLDSFAHLSGFVLNAAETTPADAVYISHGWGSMKVVGQLSASKKYQSYVRMQETRTRGVMAGDVYFYDGPEIVAVCKDLRFQQIKRSILDHLLPPTSSTRGQVKVQQARPTAKIASKAPTRKTVQDVLLRPSVAGEDNFSTSLKIIASEVGVDISECTNDTNFSDLGIDSLLTISIHARLREALGEDIPANLFVDYETVTDLRKYFSSRGPATTIPHLNQLDSEESDSLLPDQTFSENGSPETPRTAASGVDDFDDDDSTTLLKNIISSEVGVTPEEIDGETVLAELGIDSLLSLSILNAIKLQTGKELPASFFLDHQTFREFEEAFGGKQTKQDKPKPATAHENTRSIPATSILLQGSPLAEVPNMFLLPDGSGSAGSYVGLPKLEFQGGVYGLNSPFLHCPENYVMPLQKVVELYVAEIRRVQPRGPYNLGGWSIGGSYAFEAASQLALQFGEVVQSLVLIDSPCPRTLPPLPIETIDTLEAIGIFDGAMSKSNARNYPAARQALRDHFAGSVNALKLYKPLAIPKQQAPKAVTILWASKGIWETVSDQTKLEYKKQGARGERNLASDWMMDKRSSYKACGWDDLMLGAAIDCNVVEGNHFSIMRKPGIEQLAAAINRGLGGV